MPTVSVIIPTYNRAGYLREAVQSVLDQSFHDFEIIIVDDGSLDATREVAKNFEDNRIRYYYQANSGRSIARNRGLELAEGDYIAFLDDDDLYLPNKILCQLLYLENEPEVDLVVSGSQIIDENGKLISVLRTWEVQPTLTLLSCLYACPIHTCAILIRRRSLLNFGIWFDPEMTLAEDSDFLIRLLYAGARFSWLSQIVSSYRIHSSNSQGNAAGYGQLRLKLLDKIFSFPALPEEIHRRRDDLYAHSYLLSACHCYAAKQERDAQMYLEEAYKKKPALLSGSPCEFAAEVANYATTVQVKDPRDYIEYVINNLPVSLADFNHLRSKVLNAFYLQRIFLASKKNIRPYFVDWLAAVYYEPSWLLNRGMWSILVRKIFAIGTNNSFTRY